MRNFDVAKRRFGFSLTEVLIVLAVLGFVASVILGVIKVNSVKQFMAGRSIFTSDLATALSVMNMEHPLVKFNDTDNSVEFIKNFSDYFDIVRLKDYDTRNDIFSENMKDLAGDKVTFKKYDQYFVTKNGVSVALSYVKSATVLPKFVQDQSRISVSGENYEIATQALNFVTGVYDLNGKKGPNVLGRDIGIIMPGYPINERAGEYFASTNTGTFFVGLKGSKGVPPEDKPAGPGGPGGSGDPGNPGNPPGDNPDPKCDPNRDENHCCPAGTHFDTTVCCPIGQKEITPGVCAQDCECQDTASSSNILTEHQCQLQGPGWHLTKKTITVESSTVVSVKPECEARCTNTGKSSNTKIEYECACTLQCPQGQHLNKEKCECESTPPQCEYTTIETSEGWNDRDCKPIKGTKTEWGYKCDMGAPFECIASGGKWDAECCRCKCSELDEEINAQDVCGLKGAYCDSSGGACSRSGKLACHYNNLPSSKNTYYTVGEDTAENNCFSCSPAKISGKGKYDAEHDQGNVNMPKRIEKGNCGCDTTCDNETAYTKTATVLFDNITPDSKNACLWHCKKTKKPNNDYMTWTGLPTCAWGCSLKSTDTCAVNGNYSVDTDKCEWKCTKTKEPGKPKGGDIQGTWVWIGGENKCAKDSCAWVCNFNLNDGQKADYNLNYNTCTGTLKCKLSKTICDNFLAKCVKPQNSGNYNNDCARTQDAKSAFYDRRDKTYTTDWSKYDTVWRPFGWGFDPYQQGSYFKWSNGKATFKDTNKNGKPYITCDTTEYTEKEVKFDANECACVVSIKETTPHRPYDRNNNIYDNKNSYDNQIYRVFQYQGWNFTDRNGKTNPVNWLNYTCSYDVTGSNSYDIINDSSSIGGGFTCAGTKGLPKNSGTSGYYKNGTINYVSRVKESCYSENDPIVLIKSKDESADSITSKFTLDTNRAKTLDDGKIYWFASSDIEDAHPFLVKLKYFTKENESGAVKENNRPTTVTSWDHVKNLMFTDMGYVSSDSETGSSGQSSGFSSGIDELVNYANAGRIKYLDGTNSMWNNLGIATVRKNGDIVNVKSLDEYNIAEIWLESQRTSSDTNRGAGAIGNVISCYRMGTGTAKGSLSNGEYVRTITSDKKVLYCPSYVGNGTKTYDELKNQKNPCLDEIAVDGKKYTFSEGKCELNTELKGKTYIKGKDGYYLEEAFPYVDVLFKSVPQAADD